MTSDFEPRVDRVSRVLPASASRVYGALLDQRALETWLPPAGMTGRYTRFEPRVGGRSVLELTYSEVPVGGGKTAESRDVSESVFVELVEGERVAQQIVFESDDARFAGTMTMVWELAEFPGGTLVTVSAYDVPSGISQADHVEGISSSLENLSAFVGRS
ncbi:SRPBCC domain-containing protein [Pseudoclavibacter sp. RFBB5]|uniref:SRPBCC domain-containing protein n=1 Tax=Pseudoclavibacter sp. RFBB5 TaxID=2080574 RepID=UPI000CE78F43|nr:SRPBCC domain-containing protein [Pseudoclavibacter sp. RFBB5]PPG29175.1 ATPase [Pseudoclavibacter sp. RFBB5]